MENLIKDIFGNKKKLLFSFFFDGKIVQSSKKEREIYLTFLQHIDLSKKKERKSSLAGNFLFLSLSKNE